MGSVLSRSTAAQENADAVSNSAAFRYPHKTGSYFANYFIMGGERFDSPQPEAYLFGENADLNFLTGKPMAFPYTVPAASELGKPLKSVINIRRESLRLVRVLNDIGTSASGYNIEFNFDADVSCTIRIIYFAKEEFVNHGLSYVSQDPSLSSEKYSYKKGPNQLFNQTAHVFDPSNYSEEELMDSSVDKEIMPIVIQCLTADDEEIKQCHVTLAVIEKHPDGTYVLKALKQKQCIDGLCYLLQEVYGIENKTAGGTEYDSGEEEYEESGGDCVVCMSDPRDTLILPCRHLCLCNGCAESLRYQANNCPICRAPFRALLQVRALQKKEVVAGTSLRTAEEEENVPLGYEILPLTEALNGPPTQNINYQPKLSPSQSPTVVKPVAGPRNRKRSKKLTLNVKVAGAEVSEAVVQPVSPAISVKSNISVSEPDLTGSRSGGGGPSGKFCSVPRGLDYAEVVNEIPIRASTVKRLEDEEDGKDSDQTTDSTSSARSFNALIRHASQDSVNALDHSQNITDTHASSN